MWNKTKYLEVKKKIKSAATKDYNFFKDRIHFASSDGSQNMCFYQPTFGTLELKLIVLSWKWKGL